MRNLFRNARFQRIARRRKPLNIDAALNPPDESVPLLAMSVRRVASPTRFRRKRQSSTGDNSLFIWTIIILLLVGFTIFCWVGSIYVFGHPEKAFNYSLLLKAKKIEPLKKFEITMAPRGEFLNADKLHEQFGSLRPAELAETNDRLLRNYVRNYKQMIEMVPYLSGTYTVMSAYEMTDKNLFPSGVAVIAQSNDNPGVLLEHAFPAPADSVPHLLRMFQTGSELNFERRPDRAIDISSVVHIEKLPDGRIKVTAVPLVYGTYTSTASDGPGTFSLSPPDHLNLAEGPPLLSADQTTEANDAFKNYLRRSGLAGVFKPSEGKAIAAKPSHDFIRVEPAQPADGGPRPTPPPPIFERTAEPVVRRAIAVGEVPMLAPDVDGALPAETPVAPPAEPIAPPRAIPVVTSTGRNWPTFAPGQAPKARTASAAEVSSMADRGIGGERIYLKGDFVVRVSGNNRAVLRLQSPSGSDEQVRVIVDYPSGFALPAQDSTLSRDDRRPLLVTNVQRAPDGTVNVFALEITKP